MYKCFKVCPVLLLVASISVGATFGVLARYIQACLCTCSLENEVAHRSPWCFAGDENFVSTATAVAAHAAALLRRHGSNKSPNILCSPVDFRSPSKSKKRLVPQ